MKKKKEKEVINKVVTQALIQSMNYKPAYVFTNWGLCKGVIVSERIDRNTGLPQYKLNIDIDKDNKNKVCNFWYTKNQLHKFYFVAIVKELFKRLF